MAAREVLSASLSLLSTLVVARILGPEKYGVVAVSLGLFYFFTFIGRMGLNVYIVRKPELLKEEVEQILTFYNTVGIFACFLLWLASPLFGWWIGNSDVTLALRILIPAVWLDMIGMTASSMLERNLDFTKVSFIYAVAEIANYAFSVTLVTINGSYISAILGYVLQFLLFAILSHYHYPIRWGFKLSRSVLKPALKYGIFYSSSDFVLNLRSLTIPVFVSRLAGIEAAAVANVALRVVQKLLLLRFVIRKMCISVMAKLIEDQDAVKRAISQGMLYQALFMGSICAVFSGFAAWVIPALFGQEWLPSAQIFPFIGFSLIISALFDLHSAVLYASDHSREVGYFNVCYIGMIWIGCLLFLPTFGVWGYGFAEMFALPSYYLMHLFLTKFYKSPNYGPTCLTVLATIPPLFGGIWLKPWPNLALMLFCYVSLLVISPKVRTTTTKLLRTQSLKI